MRGGHDTERLIGAHGKTRPSWQRRCAGPSTTNKRRCAACGSLSYRRYMVPVALARERTAGRVRLPRATMGSQRLEQARGESESQPSRRRDVATLPSYARIYGLATRTRTVAMP
jgi:hypothetical protein